MKSFMKGAVLLTLAGLMVKLLSAVYRVPFQNMVGDQGFYIYQQVYPFIGIFSIWTSYGFAVAVSKVMADHEAHHHSVILRTAFGCIAAISVLVFAVLFFGADLLAGWMGDGKLSGLLKVSAFAVMLMPPLAVLKGYFQSNNQMEPVAYSQVWDQAVRVTIILVGTWLLVSSGASLYAAGQMAMFGAVAGGIAGLLLLMRHFRRSFAALPEPASVEAGPILKKILSISFSVSMGSLLLLFFQLVDSFTVFRLLSESGVERIEAMEQKGIYDRGQPLVQFGLLIATSLSLAIVPLIAHMSKKQSGRSADLYAQLAFRTSFLFAFAAATGLTFVMPYVNETLFQTQEESFALIVFSWQIVWMSLLLVLNAILQGLGKAKVPALFLISGILVKIGCNWLLIPIWGVLGASLAGNIALALIVAGLIWYFKKVWPLRFAPLRYYSWLFTAAFVMSAVVVLWALLSDWVLFDGLPNRMAALFTTLSAVPLGAFVFLLIIAKSRIVTEKEWYIIPFGRKMAGLQLAINSRRKR
ncbi:polysaccharide biosynthesis protein [Planomicrobium sp. CPCC 101110]|uniref:putative polysaccharide biosynthesis protein n=1 Tax=Planomicrobium sp. CPCC 101110 TaxID=2599619 RepID=UPI0011B48BD4|nr:polysaccharide biosynthesis protein [Planomicrobium sp. CPCC 101110]TWT28622.1 polysaccharide biosynthesis protein [Planomicrobium sp. CPCC 101110]